MACCTTSKTNTGLPVGCHSVMDIISALNFVDLTDGAGTKNGIDLTATLDNQYFLDRTNDTDKSKRWFPVQDVDNVAGERADDEFKEYESGRRVKIRDGVRSVSFIKPTSDIYYFKKLKWLECAKNLGVIPFDLSDNIQGSDKRDGFLDPWPIQDGTMVVRFVMPKYSDEPHIMISFDLDTRFSDENMAYINSADLASDVDSLTKDYPGLLDLYGGTATAISTTGFTIPITSDFKGTSGNPVEDIPQASFELYNETTSSVVTISTMTESPEGTYAFTFAAQTSSDELELRIASGVTGFDDTNLRTAVITIP